MHEFDRSAIPYRLVGISALERFFGIPHAPICTIETDRGVVELAQEFEGIRFPGLPNWDALIPGDELDFLVRCDRSEDHPPSALLRFTYDPQRRAFADPYGLYPFLKEARARLKPGYRSETGTIPGTIDPEPLPIDAMPVTAAATIAARLPLISSPVEPWRDDPGLTPEFHRLLLTQILTGRFAERGLRMLYDSGYIGDIVPEIEPMNATEQSKEDHPEGNVWEHTLHTFSYRKTMEVNLGLALLFHDCGKPHARANGPHRFSNHADLGAKIARTTLARLGFDRTLIDEVGWLVRFHMIPGALERLPEHRREPLMASPLFPTLLQLYRCDLESTFRGPEPFYRACRIYRRFLKRQKSDWARPRRAQIDLLVT